MFAVIFIPDFSLQAVLRHEPELIPQAVALMEPELTKLGIVQLTAGARVAGVCEGMTASQAIARCADLTIKSRSPAQEQAATEVLIQTAYAFSPFIEATAPGVCTMELRGLRIQEDESSAWEWAEEICEVLKQFHLDARIGFAGTPELGLLAVRTAKGGKLQAPNSKLHSPSSKALQRTRRNSKSQAPNNHTGRNGLLSPALSSKGGEGVPIIIVSDAAEFVSGLPIEMLGLPVEVLEILSRWGITTAGALLRLGKDQLAERLGPAATEVFERLSPNSIRPLKLAKLPETFAEQMEFENEIETLEPLLFVLRRFAEQLSRRISLLYLVVAELHLKLGLASGANYESVFRIPSPTGNAEILFRMLHTHLENVRTDAPISSLWLSAIPGRPEAHQFGLFETTLRNPNQFAETLARLEALCGPNRVGTPSLEPTLRPDSFRIKPPEFCESGELGKVGKLRYLCGLQVRRFRPPLAAQVEFREQSPALIRSSVCNGAIVDRRGPFLSSGNWWDAGRWWREEWDVQMPDGTMYRIFRTREKQEENESERSRRGDEADPGTKSASSPRRLQECFVEGVYD
jgi:protein ImuB